MEQIFLRSAELSDAFLSIILILKVRWTQNKSGKDF